VSESLEFATQEFRDVNAGRLRTPVQPGVKPVFTHQIVRASRRTDHTELVLREVGSRTHPKIYLSPFSYLWRDQKGRLLDRLVLSYNIEGQLAEISKVVDDGLGHSELSKLFPYFRVEVELRGTDPSKSRLVVREAFDSQDYSYVRHLARFHYVSNESIWGRTHHLLAFFHASPGDAGVPVGYLMLASPGLLSSPRSRLFGWTTTDQRVGNANRVVRIARVVVHPEYRGLGIGVELVRAAMAYSREYWNVQGQRPWLVETVAEMSRYHPVFEKAGMIPFGETAGSKGSIFVPKSKLRSGQGPGFYRASIYRIKGKPRSPKPYFWCPVRSDVWAMLTVKPAGSATEPETRPRETQLNHPPLVRLEDVSVSLTPLTSWAEPRLRLSEYHSSLGLTRNSLDELGTTLSRTREIQAQLLADSRIDAAIGDLSSARLRRLSNARVTSLRRRLGRLNLMVGPHKSAGSQRRSLTRSSRDLDLWDSERIRAISSLERLVKTLERSLVHTKKNDKNRRTSSLRVALLHLIDGLRSGPSSDRFDLVKRAFGVRESTVLPVLEHIDLDILPGQTVMITGPSGSGKSTLLNVITGAIRPSSGRITGYSCTEDVGILDLNFDPTKRLIDLVGENTSDAISTLNSVGLTEAGLYLRRRDELSHGQRYRAAVALLVSSRKKIWIADEFCTFLDPVTAGTVCKGVRNLVSKYGVTFIAATPDPTTQQGALRPDVTVRLESGRVAWPRLVLCSWGGPIRLRAFLSCLRRIKRSKGPRVSRRMLHALSALGLIERIVAVDNPPRFCVTDVGQSILAAKDPATTLTSHLYRTDLVLHRLVNTRRCLGEHRFFAFEKASAARLGFTASGWTRSGLNREVASRTEIANTVLRQDREQTSSSTNAARSCTQ
jgi:ABC-type lipoprotein export system ATPase subunit/ribosomal protein S18 acetylase RimI-like enzyme